MTGRRVWIVMLGLALLAGFAVPIAWTAVSAVRSADTSATAADGRPSADATPTEGNAANGTAAASGAGSAGTAAPAEQPSEAAPPPGPTGPVTLAFGGDVHFESYLGDAVRADPQGALSPVGDLFAKADVAVVNLETAVTDRGAAAPKQYNFRAPRKGLTALQAAGVDVVSLANNHGMDFGYQGLRDTLRAARRADLPLVGAGHSAKQAYRPHEMTVNGRRVAILGATQVLDTFAIEAWTARGNRAGLASAKEDHGGLRRLLRAVRQADERVDTVVVVLHWGLEGASCPLPRQEELAEQLADAGADIVVGGHAHRLQAGGFLGDTVVHYGLGNFVFYTDGGPGADSGVFSVTIARDDAVRTTWRPAVLQSGVATRLTGDSAAAARRSWRDLRSCTNLTAKPTR